MIEPHITKSLVLLGMMGVGKTTLGRYLSQGFRLPFIDADQEIERVSLHKITELFEKYGEKEFRNVEKRVVQRLAQLPPHIIALGGGAFINEDTRNILLKKTITIWVDVPFQTIFTRVSRNTTRPLLKTKDPKATLLQLIEERKPYYSQAHIHFINDYETKRATINAFKQQLSAYLKNNPC